VQAAQLMAGGELMMDRLDPAPGLATAHNIFGEITDSAAAATPLATGFKTEGGNISMAADDETALASSTELARDKGMATGLITKLYFQDATPGAWLAHAPERHGCRLRHREPGRRRADADPELQARGGGRCARRSGESRLVEQRLRWRRASS
jgi:alkaline phosphatase